MYGPVRYRTVRCRTFIISVKGLNKELLTNLMGYYYCHWMGMESLYTVCVRTGCFP